MAVEWVCKLNGARTRHTIDVEALIRIMVLNRLCDLDSKLGVLRWLQTVALPDMEVQALTHQQLLRSMDALMDHQDAVDGVIASLLRPLVDQDLAIAFYDMTTIRAEGLATVEGDVRRFGMAKEGLIARQFMLGMRYAFCPPHQGRPQGRVVQLRHR